VIRALHAIDSLRRGGAESLLVTLVERMTASCEVDSVVAVASSEGADPALVELVGGAARLVMLDAPRVTDPRFLRYLIGLLRARPAGVVHSHLAGANIHSRVAARLAGVPHLTTIHTPPGPAMEDRAGRALADGLTARLSTCLVTTSSQVAAAYARAFRIPGDRFAVIPPAPAARRSAGPREVAAGRAELLGPDGSRLVLCVSRLQREKGVADLLRAAARLKVRLPGMRVAVAGDGPERARLASLARTLGVEDVVSLLGHRPDVGDLLAMADAFCLPSRHEGVPVSLLEAMAASRPCVATAVGGIPDVVEDGRTALLVPALAPGRLADTLERVLTDAVLAERVARAAGRVAATEYTADAMARRYADLYARVSR
jgi:glycosyltransferase involved in cell wall biosynthesis